MTLEEAIIHCEDVANDRAGCCKDYAEEHRQLAEWLKELRAYRQMTEPEKVRCIDCEHLRTMLTQGKHLPGAICASPIWKAVGREPHVVWHDLFEPIRCDHFEKKEGQNDGKV